LGQPGILISADAKHRPWVCQSKKPNHFMSFAQNGHGKAINSGKQPFNKNDLPGMNFN